MENDWKSRELYELYISNDEPSYRRLQAMNINLARKKFKGIYDPEKAPKLYLYLVDDALKQYKKEYPDSDLAKEGMTKQDKLETAKSMTEDFENEFKEGEYNKYMQKYLAKKPVGWRMEQYRHALAARGIKTGRKK
jgi:hypothetical protein